MGQVDKHVANGTGACMLLLCGMASRSSTLVMPAVPGVCCCMSRAEVLLTLRIGMGCVGIGYTKMKQPPSSCFLQGVCGAYVQGRWMPVSCHQPVLQTEGCSLPSSRSSTRLGNHDRNTSTNVQGSSKIILCLLFGLGTWEPLPESKSFGSPSFQPLSQKF